MAVFQRVPRAYRRVKEHFVGGNRLELLRNGPQAFPAMLKAIAGAERQVLLEMYWFGSDAVGRRIGDALLAARRRGVEVFVIYDSIGSLDADSDFFEELREGGIPVIEYNPILPWRRRFKLSRVSRRDHRKILVVDGVIGFTGGINIGEFWWPEDPEEEPWRDDMVRVEGPAVRGFVDCFVEVWKRQGGAPFDRVRPTELSRPIAEGDRRVRVLGQAYFRNRRQIGRAYLHHIYGAEARVWITNSYFVPDRRVVRALRRAAERGVDVRVLLPGKIDVKIVRYASRATWSRLLGSGVRLYEFQGNVLHAKTAVIDGKWSTIGTFNLDHLSVFANLEVNLSVDDPELAKAVEGSFERDLERSHEVVLSTFRYRPLGERLLESFLYLFRRVM